MTQKKTARPLLLFYLLVAYVFVQFTWWSYHLVQLNNEVYDLRSELIILKSSGSDEVAQAEQELRSRLNRRWYMIAGEGIFFLILLILGHLKVRSSFRKEAALASLQRNFLLSITHELKTPLASSRLQLETLLKRELDRDKQKEILSNAITDNERLSKLVENILLAARIDNSSYDLHKEQTDLSAFISHVVSANLRWLQQKHTVLTNIQPGIFYAIDKLAFESVVLNLLENAVKYSPAGTTILLSLEKRANKTVLGVKDEGPGVADTEKEEIFKKFYRSGNEETRTTKGTGLGLYIADHLVREHNGTITVRDNSPAGSIFEVCME